MLAAKHWRPVGRIGIEAQTPRTPPRATWSRLAAGRARGRPPAPTLLAAGAIRLPFARLLPSLVGKRGRNREPRTTSRAANRRALVPAGQTGPTSQRQRQSPPVRAAIGRSGPPSPETICTAERAAPPICEIRASAPCSPLRRPAPARRSAQHPSGSRPVRQALTVTVHRRREGGQVHVFGSRCSCRSGRLAEKWTSPQPPCERLPLATLPNELPA